MWHLTFRVSAPEDVVWLSRKDAHRLGTFLEATCDRRNLGPQLLQAQGSRAVEKAIRAGHGISGVEGPRAEAPCGREGVSLRSPYNLSLCKQGKDSQTLS